jgi:hypothetical protein
VSEMVEGAGREWVCLGMKGRKIQRGFYDMGCGGWGGPICSDTNVINRPSM